MEPLSFAWQEQYSVQSQPDGGRMPGPKTLVIDGDVMWKEPSDSSDSDGVQGRRRGVPQAWAMGAVIRDKEWEKGGRPGRREEAAGIPVANTFGGVSSVGPAAVAAAAVRERRARQERRRRELRSDSNLSWLCASAHHSPEDPSLPSAPASAGPGAQLVPQGAEHRPGPAWGPRAASHTRNSSSPAVLSAPLGLPPISPLSKPLPKRDADGKVNRAAYWPSSSSVTAQCAASASASPSRASPGPSPAASAGGGYVAQRHTPWQGKASSPGLDLVLGSTHSTPPGTPHQLSPAGEPTKHSPCSPCDSVHSCIVHPNEHASAPSASLTCRVPLMLSPGQLGSLGEAPGSPEPVLLPPPSALPSSGSAEVPEAGRLGLGMGLRRNRSDPRFTAQHQGVAPVAPGLVPQREMPAGEYHCQENTAQGGREMGPWAGKGTAGVQPEDGFAVLLDSRRMAMAAGTVAGKGAEQPVFTASEVVALLHGCTRCPLCHHRLPPLLQQRLNDATAASNASRSRQVWDWLHKRAAEAEEHLCEYPTEGASQLLQNGAQHTPLTQAHEGGYGRRAHQLLPEGVFLGPVSKPGHQQDTASEVDLGVQLSVTTPGGDETPYSTFGMLSGSEKGSITMRSGAEGGSARLGHAAGAGLGTTGRESISIWQDSGNCMVRSKGWE